MTTEGHLYVLMYWKALLKYFDPTHYAWLYVVLW